MALSRDRCKVHCLGASLSFHELASLTSLNCHTSVREYHLALFMGREFELREFEKYISSHISKFVTLIYFSDN